MMRYDARTRAPAESHVATGTNHSEPEVMTYACDGASIAFEAQRPNRSEGLDI